MTQPPQAVPTYAQVPVLKPHRGVLILVFGILSLVICMPLGIVAWVLGNSDLKEMAAGLMDRSGEGMTRAGKICGIISVILACCFLIIWLLVAVVLVGSGAAMSPR